MALLGIRDFGAPSSNIQHLADLGLSVCFGQGSLAGLETHLERDEPCVVFLRTGELPYWTEDTGVQVQDLQGFGSLVVRLVGLASDQFFATNYTNCH